MEADGRLYMGLIDSVDAKLGVKIRFPGFTQQVAVKDLEHMSDVADHYPIGSPVRSGFNKQGRLSLKNQVLARIMTTEQQAKDRTHLLA